MVSATVKTVAVIATFGIASEIVYQAYKWIRNRRRRSQVWPKTESRRETHEVLFFPDKDIACKDYFVGEDGCYNPKCRFTHKPNSLSRLYGYLAGAVESVDVCVFVICCQDLADILVQLHRKDIKVRIICDDEQVDITGSQIWPLRKEGISVRTDHSSYLMHHKFIVIDNQLLITGSFNWTRQAISGNQENLLILNHRETVRKYLTEFERLWNEFNPRKSIKSELHRTASGDANVSLT